MRSTNKRKIPQIFDTLTGTNQRFRSWVRRLPYTWRQLPIEWKGITVEVDRRSRDPMNFKSLWALDVRAQDQVIQLLSLNEYQKGAQAAGNRRSKILTTFQVRAGFPRMYPQGPALRRIPQNTAQTRKYWRKIKGKQRMDSGTRESGSEAQSFITRTSYADTIQEIPSSIWGTIPPV